jgi:hypothetical protein
MSKSEVNGSNFRRKVAAVIRSGKSIRGNVQELVQYAVVRYLDPASNGDTSDMTYLFQQIAGVKSLNHRILGEYIEDTVNVALRKTQDGTPVFRKAKKGETPTLLDNADLSAPWWEHGRVTEAKALDAIKKIRADIKALESTQGDEPKRTLIAGQEVCVQGLINDLMGAVARAESAITRAELEAACVDTLEEAA